MKYIKYAFVVFLCVFSFYFSDRVIIFVENQSPIMKEIKANSESLRSEPVNAVIDGNTIVPGQNGYEVNERESYLKMNEFGAFNDTFYVYDAILPEVSLYDNLDKIIIRSSKNDSVALIVESAELAEYLDSVGITYSKIIYEADEAIEDQEYLNGNAYEEDFDELNSFFKRKKMNNKICVIGYSNLSLCKKYEYFLVSPSVVVYPSNLADAKSRLSGGDIVLLSDSLSLGEAKIIVNQLKYKSLNFVELSTLISEE